VSSNGVARTNSWQVFHEATVHAINMGVLKPQWGSIKDFALRYERSDVEADAPQGTIDWLEQVSRVHPMRRPNIDLGMYKRPRYWE
jgi:hypothetical protein